jgi:6-phospho-3-hexuloisomerase
MVSVNWNSRVLQKTATSIVQESLHDAIDLIVLENQRTLEQLNYRAVEQVIHQITTATKIFVTGEGRSGLIIRMLAMRLMHLGCQVYVVGETITPSIKEGDLLIACSGSGSTGNVCTIAAKAKKIGAHLIGVTTQLESPLGKMSDIAIKVAAAAKQDHSQEQSKQFSGSLFEQSTLVIFDALFHVLAQKLNKSTETLWALHTNLE